MTRKALAFDPQKRKILSTRCRSVEPAREQMETGKNKTGVKPQRKAAAVPTTKPSRPKRARSKKRPERDTAPYPTVDDTVEIIGIMEAVDPSSRADDASTLYDDPLTAALVEIAGPALPKSKRGDEATPPQGSSTVGSLAQEVSAIEGLVAAALVDSSTGAALSMTGGDDRLLVEEAARSTTEMLMAERAAIEAIGIEDTIDDIVITQKTHYHVVVPVPGSDKLVLYIALDRSNSNLMLARRSIRAAAASIGSH